MKKIITFLVLVATLTNCVEEYDLEIAEASPRLVVEGLITNELRPYYIRLTESHNGKIYPSYDPWKDNLTPVKDALVIITDNVNQIDTLSLVDNIEDYEYDTTSQSYYKLVYDDFGNVIDTIWWSYSDDPLMLSFDKGYYKTQNLVGIPGRTYSLKIIYQNKEYRADAYMPPVPDIDSVGYTIKKDGLGGKIDLYFPLLYFSEPQETKDYYLIQQKLGQHWANDMAGLVQSSSILSDEFLQPYVDGLKISSLYMYDVFQDHIIHVRLHSLTREAYLFYKNIIQQYDNDGGTFQPAPASPPTNISNGALGFFRASAISGKIGILGSLNISTLEVTEITATTAISGGELIFRGLIQSKGICWSTNPNPTTNDFTIISNSQFENSYPCKMTDLTPNTKYYVRAFVKPGDAPEYYGNQVEFTTLAE